MTGKIKRYLGVLLTLAMVIGLLPGMSMTAQAIAVNDIYKIGDTISFGTNEVWCRVSYDGSTLVSGDYTLIYEGYDNRNGKYNFKFGDENWGYSVWIYTVNKGAPYGIKVTGGDGTLNNPFALAVVIAVPVTGVTLSPDTAQRIPVGEKVAFTATVFPENATDKKVK